MQQAENCVPNEKDAGEPLRSFLPASKSRTQAMEKTHPKKPKATSFILKLNISTDDWRCTPTLASANPTFTVIFMYSSIWVCIRPVRKCPLHQVLIKYTMYWAQYTILRAITSQVLGPYIEVLGHYKFVMAEYIDVMAEYFVVRAQYTTTSLK